jgi:hypothetical protein
VNEEKVDHRGERAGSIAARELGDQEIDLLLERNPTFVEDCRQIRERMKQGKYLTHEQVLAALAESPEV